VYAESSAVLRWLFAEDLGEQIRTTFSAADKVVTSRLTLIEVGRVIRRSEREGRITAAQAADLRSVLARAAATWAILEISADVARRAEEAFPAEPVQTLDAIHLASALILMLSLPDLKIVTTDGRIRENALKLGLPIEPSG
jgi:predicted nucleic acid-binding protein